MRKNKKGFTLIEILAAVTILGVLSIVAVVSVNKIIQKAKQNHYITAEDNLEMAGQSYVQQNRNALPKAIGQKKQIPLKTLVEKNYIEPIKDYSDNECNLENSYVQVFKYSKEDYSYVAYLDCPVYDSKEQLAKSAPTVNVTLTNAGSTKTAKAHMKVEDQEKLLSWSYIVYRDGKEVLNSGSIMLPNYDKKVEKTLNISKFTPGKIRIVVTATNIYGQTTKATSQTIDYKDEQKPTCIIKEVDKETNPKPWTQEPKTITVGCDDGEGSGCTREEYTKTFKSTTDVGNITIEDESGNKTVCKVSVNVDITPPECTVELAGTTGENGWYKSKDVTVTLKRTDNHSGVGSYDLTTSSTPSYNNKNRATQSDISNIIWYGYIKDSVGNVNKCDSGNFKVDTTKPTCSVTKSGTTGNNGWYKEKNVTLTLNPTDNLSGIQQTGLSTSTTPTLGKVTTGTQSDIASVTWYGRVKDNAGNISNVCDSGNFKVDTTKPTCSVSFSGTNGNNGWYKATNATVSLSTNDNLSKVERYGLTTSTSATYNSSKSSTQGNTAGQRWNGYVMDYAGNINSCNNTVKVDTSNPSCTVTLSGTKGNNGWYKSQNVTVTLNPTDSGPSGVDKTGLGTSSSPTLGSTRSGSQGNTSGVTWYGRVQDAAGNQSAVCNSGNFKVDKTPPYVTRSPGPGNYQKNESFYVTATCNDDLSGVSSRYDLTFKGLIACPITEEYVGKCCEDKAGNEMCNADGKYTCKVYGRDPSCGVERYKSCAHKDCGYQTCRTSGCGVASYNTCRTSACGVYRYKSCSNSACGTTTSYGTGLRSRGGGSCSAINGTWLNGKKYTNCQRTTSSLDDCTCTTSWSVNKTCRTSACGVESYNSCATSACGVASYKSCANSACGNLTCRTSACGVDLYKECWHY